LSDPQDKQVIINIEDYTAIKTDIKALQVEMETVRNRVDSTCTTVEAHMNKEENDRATLERKLWVMGTIVIASLFVPPELLIRYLIGLF